MAAIDETLSDETLNDETFDSVGMYGLGSEMNTTPLCFKITFGIVYRVNTR